MYGLPLSVVLMKNGVWGCWIRHQKLAPITRHEVHDRRCGMLYFQWKFDIECEVIDLGDEEDNIACYGLLLPYLSKDGKGRFSREGLYTLVTSEWNEMTVDGSIQLQNVVSFIQFYENTLFPTFNWNYFRLHYSSCTSSSIIRTCSSPGENISFLISSVEHFRCFP